MRSSHAVASVTALAYTVLLSYLLVAPSPLAIFGGAGEATEEAIDTSLAGFSQHVIAYVILTVLWSWAWGPRPGRSLVLAAGVLHGGLAELAQAFVPLRDCDWMDAAANVLGVAVGAVLVLGIARLSRGSVQRSGPSPA